MSESRQLLLAAAAALFSSLAPAAIDNMLLGKMTTPDGQVRQCFLTIERGSNAGSNVFYKLSYREEGRNVIKVFKGQENREGMLFALDAEEKNALTGLLEDDFFSGSVVLPDQTVVCSLVVKNGEFLRQESERLESAQSPAEPSAAPLPAAGGNDGYSGKARFGDGSEKVFQFRVGKETAGNGRSFFIKIGEQPEEEFAGTLKDGGFQAASKTAGGRIQGVLKNGGVKGVKLDAQGWQECFFESGTGGAPESAGLRDAALPAGDWAAEFVLKGSYHDALMFVTPAKLEIGFPKDNVRTFRLTREGYGNSEIRETFKGNLGKEYFKAAVIDGRGAVREISGKLRDGKLKVLERENGKVTGSCEFDFAGASLSGGDSEAKAEKDLPTPKEAKYSGTLTLAGEDLKLTVLARRPRDSEQGNIGLTFHLNFEDANVEPRYFRGRLDKGRISAADQEGKKTLSATLKNGRLEGFILNEAKEVAAAFRAEEEKTETPDIPMTFWKGEITKDGETWSLRLTCGHSMLTGLDVIQAIYTRNSMMYLASFSGKIKDGTFSAKDDGVYKSELESIEGTYTSDSMEGEITFRSGAKASFRAVKREDPQ